MARAWTRRTRAPRPPQEPTAQTEPAVGPLWCDGHPMDLLSLFPVLEGELRAMEADLWAPAPYAIWTIGHKSVGRLNHPAVWNADGELTAYFGITPPKPGRDATTADWLPNGSTAASGRPVRTTVSDALRDVWMHHYSLVIEGRRVLGDMTPEFNLILSVVRGHNRRLLLEPRDRQSVEARVLDVIRAAMARAAEGVTLARVRETTT